MSVNSNPAASQLNVKERSVSKYSPLSPVSLTPVINLYV
jgi:hypothetical protein